MGRILITMRSWYSCNVLHLIFFIRNLRKFLSSERKIRCLLQVKLTGYNFTGTVISFSIILSSQERIRNKSDLRAKKLDGREKFSDLAGY